MGGCGAILGAAHTLGQLKPPNLEVLPPWYIKHEITLRSCEQGQAESQYCQIMRVLTARDKLREVQLLIFVAAKPQWTISYYSFWLYVSIGLQVGKERICKVWNQFR